MYDFNRIQIADIVNHLQHVASQEGVETEVEALNIIAQKADGGMRDALSIFDQTVSYTGGNITYQAVIENLNVLDYEYYFRLSDAIIQGNVVEALLTLNDILNRGFEGQYIISGIASHFRDLLVCKDPATAQLFQVGASIRDRYIATAKQCSNEFLYEAIEIANDCDLNYRLSKNKRLLLELALIRLCQLTGEPKATEEEKKNKLQPLTPVNDKPAATGAPAGDKSTANATTAGNKSVATGTPAGDTAASPAEGTGTTQEAASKETTTTQHAASKEAGAEESTPAPTAPKKKSLSHSGMGVSIASLVNKEEEEKTENKQEEAAGKPNGNNQFTEDELVAAWLEYAEMLTKEKLLKNTMSLCLPKMKGDTLFDVGVNTELNKQYFADHSRPILTFLREKLKNDDITMTLSIAKGNAIKRAVTSHEIFDEMVEKNPSLQKLSDEFGLELS